MALHAFWFTPVTLAQDVPAPPVQADPALSEVELIIFRYLDQGATTAETDLPPPAGTTDAAGGEDPGRVSSEMPGSVATYPTLSPSALRLGNVAARLRRPGSYEVLYHGGWVLPVADRPGAIRADLPAEALARGLKGGLELYQRRFLHVAMDMQLAGAPGTFEPQRIRQERRIRGSAPHYFDNPGFGVILAVRPQALGIAAQAP